MKIRTPEELKEAPDDLENKFKELDDAANVGVNLGQKPAILPRLNEISNSKPIKAGNIHKVIGRSRSLVKVEQRDSITVADKKVEIEKYEDQELPIIEKRNEALSVEQKDLDLSKINFADANSKPDTKIQPAGEEVAPDAYKIGATLATKDDIGALRNDLVKNEPDNTHSTVPNSAFSNPNLEESGMRSLDNSPDSQQIPTTETTKAVNAEQMQKNAYKTGLDGVSIQKIEGPSPKNADTAENQNDRKPDLEQLDRAHSNKIFSVVMIMVGIMAILVIGYYFGWPYVKPLILRSLIAK